MKIVLTQDVPKVGEMGTIQDVKSGFARNFLIPQGLAQIATPGMVKQVEERQDAERRRIARLEEEMKELADAIQGTRIEIHTRVGEQGRLYGSVTSSDIAEKLSEAVGQEIDRRTVELEAPIRAVGEFEVPVRLVGRLIPTITVAVFDPDAPMTAADLKEAEEGEAAAEDEVVTEVEPETAEAAAIPTATPEDMDEEPEPEGTGDESEDDDSEEEDQS